MPVRVCDKENEGPTPATRIPAEVAIKNLDIIDVAATILAVAVVSHKFALVGVAMYRVAALVGAIIRNNNFCSCCFVKSCTCPLSKDFVGINRYGLTT